jgi:WhiB family redox-sensing transcriptional regulator
MATTWAARGAVEQDDRWRTKASCRHTDPELFFPIGSTGSALDHVAAAKAVCAQCPVQVPCLDYALATNQDAGVWGGTSEEDRRALRRRARRAG